jgi:cbb3-type cytochrome oxidase maturation protein
MSVNDTLSMEMIVSLLLSFTMLFIFIWGVKTNQFDDSKRMMDGLLYDSEDELQDAIKKEAKIKKLKEDKVKRQKEVK